MSTAFAFDLDGTITAAELLPLIAREIGLERELALLTQLTLSGAIPFEDSFRLRCAILSTVPISVVRKVVTKAPLHQELVTFIQARPERCFIVTGNLDVWVGPILERLRCSAFTSTALFEGDKLLRPDTILDKSRPIHELQLRFDRVVAIGESVNDLPMFEAADIGVAFGRVHPPTRAVQDISDYVVFEGEALCRLLSTL